MEDVWIDAFSTPDRVIVNVGEPIHVRSRYRATTPVNAGLQVVVEFDLSDEASPPRLIGAGVRNPTDGIVPGEMRRHAWTRWINVAQAWTNMVHGQTVQAGDEFRRVLDAAQHTLSPHPPKRPGRKGHPESHYVDIANRYTALVVAGSRSPVADIGREMVVSTNTASGWVKECRRRGLLDPGHSGRAG